MQEIYRVKTSPVALSDNMIIGEKYRITLLTEALVRLEYSEDGVFEDRATQTVLFRDFPKTGYHVVRNADGIEVHTSMLHLIYNEKEFSSHGLSIQIKGNLSAYHSIWHYGEKVHDLQGTARTLDDVNGEVELGHGVVSRFGYSILDDSKSQILLDDGWIEPRKKGVSDLYFFGYGHDYKQALNDFYRLCGKTPMLPRYALGNWWSRYYKYSEESYMELMDKFDEKNIPFTVAVIDMDWHQVDVDPKYGSGWTGYTWNKKLFPAPKRFLGKLHDRGMHTTLNVHPADGVQGCEEMYVDMAKEMGVDYEKELTLKIKHVAAYRQLKPIYDRYQASKDKEKFLRGYEREIILFEAAARECKRLGAVPLPSAERMQTEMDALTARRAALTAERQKARREEQDYAAVRRNVEEFLSPPRQAPARQKDMELE